MAAVIRRIRRNRGFRNNLPRPRVFKDRQDPLLDLNDDELFIRYRFRRGSLIFLEGELNESLSHTTKRNFALLPMVQILICLRFLATGAFHLLVGDSVAVSKSSAGRCARNVCRVIVRTLLRMIQFPTDERAERVMEGFRKIAGFPQVLGCIDGTQIKISTPSTNEVDFVNRKGFHALNVQMICDPWFRITSVSANWPGSVHDSRIWRECALREQFENDQHNGMLLGDSGYPCTRYLMTPYLTPNTRAEENFNRSLCRTRVLIEQTFGILKRRFSILHHGIRTSPERAVMYITACAILHNIGINRGDVLISDVDLEIPPNLRNNLDQQVNIRGDGKLKRQHLTNLLFSN